MKYPISRPTALFAVGLLLAFAGIVGATTILSQRSINRVHPEMARLDIGAKIDDLLSNSREQHDDHATTRLLLDEAMSILGQNEVQQQGNAITGVILIQDGSAEDIQSTGVVHLKHFGSTYLAVADAARIITGGGTDALASGDTVDQSTSGAFWASIDVTVLGTLELEAGGGSGGSQDFGSAIIALANYSISGKTLPPSNKHVPVGVFSLTEGGSGDWTCGTDSISGETQVFYSFSGGLPVNVVSGTVAATTDAATYAYGAGVGRLGTGTVFSYTGATGQAIQAGTVADGAVGAWLIYLLADDDEVAIPLTVAATSLANAKDVVGAHTRNPLLVWIGTIYVQNESGSNFVGATTKFDATGITTTLVEHEPLTTANYSFPDTLTATTPDALRADR